MFVQKLPDLLDQGIHLLLRLATPLAVLLLAVEKIARVAKDYLKAPGGPGVSSRGDLDLVAEFLFKERLQAVVKPPVSSPTAVHYLDISDDHTSRISHGHRARLLLPQCRWWSTVKHFRGRTER